MPTIFKFIFLLFALTPLFVKSQDKKDVFLSISKQASLIETTLDNMNASIKKDKHKEAEQQTHQIETALANIEQQSNALPLENGQRVLSLTDSFKTDIKNFEKLTHKSSVFDNDKALAAAFAPLKGRIASLREYLRAAYSALVANTENGQTTTPATDTSHSSMVHTSPPIQTPPVQEPIARTDTPAITTPPVSTARSKTNTPTAKTNTPVSQGANNNTNESTQPVASTSTGGYMSVIDNIHQAQQQITGWIDQLHLAVKKSQSDKIRSLSKNIMISAAKIQDLTMLLKDDQKNNVSKLAGGLVQYASKLQALLLKGHSAHEQLHQTLDLMEIRYSVLSKGISMLK